MIFDLGGVLVDLDWQRCVDAFKAIGADKMEQILSTTHQEGFLLDYEQGLITTDDFRNQVRAITERKVSDSEVDAAMNALLVGLPEEKLQLILALKKKYKIFMLSNTNETSYTYIVENYFEKRGKKVEEYFDKVYLSYEMGLSKPDKRIYQQILDESGFAPQECLFLDDSEANLIPPREMGLHTLYVEPYSDIELEF